MKFASRLLICQREYSDWMFADDGDVVVMVDSIVWCVADEGDQIYEQSLMYPTSQGNGSGKGWRRNVMRCDAMNTLPQQFRCRRYSWISWAFAV